MVQKLPQNLQNLPEYTESQVRDSAGERCIVIIYDLVYDLTEFMEEHPGGMEVIYEMVNTPNFVHQLIFLFLVRIGCYQYFWRRGT